MYSRPSDGLGGSIWVTQGRRWWSGSKVLDPCVYTCTHASAARPSVTGPDNEKGLSTGRHQMPVSVRDTSTLKLLSSDAPHPGRIQKAVQQRAFTRRPRPDEVHNAIASAICRKIIQQDDQRRGPLLRSVTIIADNVSDMDKGSSTYLASLHSRWFPESI